MSVGVPFEISPNMVPQTTIVSLWRFAPHLGRRIHFPLAEGCGLPVDRIFAMACLLPDVRERVWQWNWRVGGGFLGERLDCYCVGS